GAGARERGDPGLGVGIEVRIAYVGVDDLARVGRGGGVYLEVQVIVRRAAGVADQGDDFAGADAVADLLQQARVVIVDGEEKELSVVGRQFSVVADGDGVRPRLGRPRVNDHAVADGVHGRAVGVVVLDALVRLEVAAHSR